MRTCMHRCRLLSFFPSWNCWLLLLLLLFFELRDESRETERKSQRAKWERLRESAHTIIQDIEEKSLGNGFGYRVNQAINDYIEPNANIDKYEIKWGKPIFPRDEKSAWFFFVGRVLLLLLLYVGCCCCACVVFFFLRAALYFFACLQSRHVYVIEFIGLKRICMPSQESRNQMSIKIKRERSEAKKKNTTHINLKWRLYYSLLFDWRWRRRRRRLMFELGAAAVYRSSPLIRLSFMPFSLFILLSFFFF